MHVLRECHVRLALGRRKSMRLLADPCLRISRLIWAWHPLTLLLHSPHFPLILPFIVLFLLSSLLRFLHHLLHRLHLLSSPPCISSRFTTTSFIAASVPCFSFCFLVGWTWPNGWALEVMRHDLKLWGLPKPVNWWTEVVPPELASIFLLELMLHVMYVNTSSQEIHTYLPKMGFAWDSPNVPFFADPLKLFHLYLCCTKFVVLKHVSFYLQYVRLLILLSLLVSLCLSYRSHSRKVFTFEPNL